MRPRSFHITTFGCQMNQYDSGRVSELMRKAGYSGTEIPERADVLILNTCMVRQHAENRAFCRLDQWSAVKSADRAVAVVVLGCLAEYYGRELRERFPRLDLILGPKGYARLPLELEGICGIAPGAESSPDTIGPEEETGPVCAHLAISQGCDNSCSYCIVPRVRGRETCRRPQDILVEARRLVRRGARQITLLGQNVNSYRWETVDFAQLLGAVAAIPGLRRLRFLTSHPRDLGLGILRTMTETDTVCPALHLPLQSGSDRVLKLMNRGYSSCDYLRVVEAARRLVPGITFTTDVMVGFPGEQEQDFRDTLQVLREVGFEGAYTYKYSPRPGTPSWDLATPNGKTVEDRLQEVIAFQRDVTRRRLQEYVGGVEPVLVEKSSRRSPGEWFGLTLTGVPVVFPDPEAVPGDTVTVEILASTGATLIGRRPESSPGVF